jgi:basic membrane protein A
MDEKVIDVDWTGTISTGSVALAEVNTQAAAEGTQAKLDEIKAKLVSGEVKVFDTSTFTVTVVTEGDNKKNVNAVVDAEGHLTSYKADVDTDAAYAADTEVVKDGYFHESEYRSAPYFDIQIDGITLLNAAF